VTGGASGSADVAGRPLSADGGLTPGYVTHAGTFNDHGVYTTPRGVINLSTALSPADLDDIAAAYETAFTLIRRA